MSTMSITIRGLLDRAHAEPLAARLRAAIRNGRADLTLNFEPGTIVASAHLLGFLFRLRQAVEEAGGHLSLAGDAEILDQFHDLGFGRPADHGDAS
jgi:hypothetical protein